ncbi:hypothetical protein KEM48_003732 [Puccinia striiformis f. sp. tritici PST-130]|nr:hypothetical protein KEM48_003732 [Puccinia striiformis f. sp. tritici PST-130]
MLLYSVVHAFILFTVLVSLLQPPHQFTNALKPLVFEIALKSPVGFRNQDEATKVTSPHGNNFLEWKFKMEAVLDGLGMSTMLSGEKSRDAAGKFIADDPDLKIQAKASLLLSSMDLSSRQ